MPSASASSGAFDFKLDAALCQRALVAGPGDDAARVRRSMDEVQRRGRLGGKPTLIVHGRDDALIPVNVNSRPYAKQSWLADGRTSLVSYFEVTLAQHFDAFLPFPDYAAATPIGLANVWPWSAAAAADARMSFDGQVMAIPD